MKRPSNINRTHDTANLTKLLHSIDRDQTFRNNGQPEEETIDGDLDETLATPKIITDKYIEKLRRHESRLSSRLASFSETPS